MNCTRRGAGQKLPWSGSRTVQTTYRRHGTPSIASEIVPGSTLVRLGLGSGINSRLDGSAW